VVALLRVFYSIRLTSVRLLLLLRPFVSRGNSQEFTNKVITLWYRPPELLLGATKYGTAVDIWSAGCILAELILGKPLFTGKTEMEQLQLIFEMLGTPTPETWEGFQDLKLLRTGEVTVGKKRKAKLREKYQTKMSPPALNLVEKLLELDPNKRLTADRALNSRYFMSEPRVPDRPEELGSLQVKGGHFHEFQTKKKRKEAKVIAEKAKQNALETGSSEKEAQEEFDAVYRGIMEKVAREGLNAGPKPDPQEIGGKDKDLQGEYKQRRDKSDRKRPGRDKERDRDSRRDKKSRDERREDRKRDIKDGDREKDKSSCKHSDADGNHDDEKRRKRKREERESRRDAERKRHRDVDGEEPSQIDVTIEGEDRAEPPTELARGMPDQEPVFEAVEGKGFSPPVPKPGFQERELDRDSSSRRRRSRSPHEKERKRSSRDERRRSREHIDRDRERSRDRRRRSEGHERDRDRPSIREMDDWDRDRGMGGGHVRDRDYERGRNDRVGRDRHPRDFDFRDDFGRGPSGPPRGGPGPEFRGGPPPPSRRDDMGSYGPASADYRGPPGPGVGPPPGYFDDKRRRDKGRSPRRGRDYRR